MSNASEQNQSRKKFKIEIQDHETFPGIARTAYVASNEFCKMVSELFKNVFADFEGCIFEVTQAGDPYISLLFNHGQYPEDAVVACTRNGGNASGSNVLDRVRTRDRQLIEGDRYHLTDDAKDALTPLLTARMFKNGNPEWKQITSEWQDRTAINFYNVGAIPQYTKVSFIDLNRLCAMIYGLKDENGDNVEYSVTIAAPLSVMGYQNGAMQSNMNFMLNITSACQEELSKVYEKLGFGGFGARIIK